jgi:hypothetical protein
MITDTIVNIAVTVFIKSNGSKSGILSIISIRIINKFVKIDLKFYYPSFFNLFLNELIHYVILDMSSFHIYAPRF